MASAAQQAKYERKRLGVIEKLKAKGFLASFGSEGDRINHGLPQPFSEICAEYVFQVEGSDQFKDIVKTGDKLFMVSNKDKLLDTCSHMKIGTEKELKIFKAEPFKTDDITTIFTWVLIRG